MSQKLHINSFTQQRLLMLLLAAEFLIFIFSGVSFYSLYGDPFFSIGVDPLSWLFYGMQIPQWILSQQWLAMGMDIIILSAFVWMIKNPLNNKLALALFVMLLIYYVTLTGYHTHRNFQTGFVLVLLPFILKKGVNRYFAFEALRYFMLFFYASSALLKLSTLSIFNSRHLSEQLLNQFAPYYLESNTGWRTSLNIFLVQHPSLTHILFVAGFVAELLLLVGFFTKRFDKWLAAIIISFHFINWCLMDIAPFGQIAFICLLFMNKTFLPAKENQ